MSENLVQFKLPKTVKHKEAKKLICNLVRDMNEKESLHLSTQHYFTGWLLHTKCI